jgi:hypothetical protein
VATRASTKLSSFSELHEIDFPGKKLSCVSTCNYKACTVDVQGVYLFISLTGTEVTLYELNIEYF